MAQASAVDGNNQLRPVGGNPLNGLHCQPVPFYKAVRDKSLYVGKTKTG